VAKKKILMMVGDFVEDCETMFAFQTLTMVGHELDAVCPGRTAGQTIKTAVHESEGSQTYSEKPGHNFLLNADFDEVDPRNYDALVIPGGRAPEYLRLDDRVLAIVRHFAENDKPIAAICHGAQLLSAVGALKGKKCSFYPAVKTEVELAGGVWIPNSETFSNAHTDGNLVSAPAWSANSEWMKEFLRLLGSRIDP
jgi:protease I